MGPICIWRHLANLPLCVTQYLFKWYILLYNEAFIGWQVSCHMVIFIKVKQPCDDQYNNPLKGRFCGEFSNILLQAVFNSRHCSSVPLCHLHCWCCIWSKFKNCINMRDSVIGRFVACMYYFCDYSIISYDILIFLWALKNEKIDIILL